MGSLISLIVDIQGESSVLCLISCVYPEQIDPIDQKRFSVRVPRKENFINILIRDFLCIRQIVFSCFTVSLFRQQA